MTDPVSSKTLADDKADLLLRNVSEFMADLPDGPTRYYLTHMKSEVERLRRESGLNDALIDAMTDCIGPEDGQTFEERAEKLIVTEVAHQNAKAHAPETLRVGASDWEEFGSAVRIVSQNCDMTDIARRGDWLQRELQARGFDIVRRPALKAECAPNPNGCSGGTCEPDKGIMCAKHWNERPENGNPQA